jgi:hypothetical protein
LRVGLVSLDLFHEVQEFLNRQCLVRHTGVQYAELAYVSSGAPTGTADLILSVAVFLFALYWTGQV